MELDDTEETQPVNDNKRAQVAAAKLQNQLPLLNSKPEPAKNPEPAASAQAAKVELVQTAEGLKAEPAKRASSSPAASTNGQNQTETTFAPKYLIRPQARKVVVVRSKYESFPRHGTSGQNSWLSLTSGCCREYFTKD